MSPKPKVLIVGAGIAGLTLGMLLEKAEIPYDIFERVAEVKPLGELDKRSAIFLGDNIVPIFKQCGIYDEFISLAKQGYFIQFYNESREIELILDFTAREKMGGAKGCIIARPKLCDLLHRQIPQERFHMSKMVVSIQQDEVGVSITCSDGAKYSGDILVGADGAYSGVRKCLYDQLKQDGKLPSHDDTPLPYSCVCIVGQTEPLDPSAFPQVADEECQFSTVLGDNKPYSWSTLTTKQNTICWLVVRYLQDYTSKQHDSNYNNSEWGPQAAEAMCSEVRDFPIPGGSSGKLVLGDIIDKTPKEYLAKIVLEEKVFDTWYGGRTVLIGDACHKLNPSGGAGAQNAIFDAIALANWINAVPSALIKDLNNIFKEYVEERLPVAKEAFKSSQMFKSLSSKV
ncbi:hypothetical protein BGX28_003217 [Mortierella sp. GBA30]|nr:hypothetical protein BGX28_003217 [Mortierella sp. GBA30]